MTRSESRPRQRTAREVQILSEPHRLAAAELARAYAIRMPDVRLPQRVLQPPSSSTLVGACVASARKKVAS